MFGVHLVLGKVFHLDFMDPEPIIASIRQSYPKAMQCAQTIGTVASLRLGSNLTEDEVAYLALHVARVVADARKHE